MAAHISLDVGDLEAPSERCTKSASKSFPKRRKPPPERGFSLAGCSRNSFDPGITGHFGLPRLTYPPTRPVLSSHQRKRWPGHGCNWQAMGEALVPAVRILRFLRPWAYRGARFRSR